MEGSEGHALTERVHWGQEAGLGLEMITIFSITTLNTSRQGSRGALRKWSRQWVVPSTARQGSGLEFKETEERVRWTRFGGAFKMT